MLLAEVVEGPLALALQVVISGAGDDHPTWGRELLEPGGDVDPVAIEVAVGLADHVAQVDADAEPDALGASAPSASRSAVPCWISAAQRTASTTLANSTR